MRPPPQVQLDFDFSLLLLLAGDVSPNPSPDMCGLRLGTVNARSIRDKAPVLSDLVASKGIDLLGITETWLTTKETSADLAGMNVVSHALLLSSISIAHLVLIQDILSYISTFPHDLALMGDFNLHIDSSSSDAGQLSGILDSFDFHQYVDFPTHSHGYSLDLMICSLVCNLLSVSASDLISDHFSVVANLQIPSNHSRTIPQTIKYRKLQSINMEAFKDDIQNSDLLKYPKTNATEQVQQYDSVLHILINLHAPLVSKKISLKAPNPWVIPAILASKRHRRYLQWVWCRNQTALNRSRLTRQTHLCNRQMSKAKSTHYSKIIAEHSDNHGSLWKAFNKILHRCPKMRLPDHSSIAALANTFSSFFINKISVIRSSFPSDSHSRGLNPHDTRKVLQNPRCVTADEVRHLILRAPCKFSDLDPTPTSLVH